MNLAEFDLPLDELQRYRPARVEPPDFDEFWSATLAEAAAHDLAVQVVPAVTPITTLEVFDVSFAGFGGDPINAWLLRDPRGAARRTCVIQFIGYGGGRGDPLDHLVWASVGYTTLVVETRGQGADWRGGTTPDPHTSHPHIPGWFTQGIRSPETYYYRRVFVDAVRAVAVARTHRLIDADRVVAAGTSQGGGIALAVAGLTGVDAVIANVPCGCHFERAVRITDQPPYNEIATYLGLYRREAAAVLRTLAYFDGVNLGARARAPALFSVGLMDRICPPSTVYAAYNHYGGPRSMRVWPFNAHEGGAIEQQLEAIAFLGGCRSPIASREARGGSPSSSGPALSPNDARGRHAALRTFGAGA